MKTNKKLNVRNYSIGQNVEGIIILLLAIWLCYYVFVMPGARPFSAYQDWSEVYRTESSPIGYLLFIASSAIAIFLMVKKRFIGGLYENEKIMLKEIYLAEKNNVKLSTYMFGKKLKRKGNKGIYERQAYRIIEELERCGYVYKTKEGMWKLTEFGNKLIINYSD